MIGSDSLFLLLLLCCENKKSETQARSEVAAHEAKEAAEAAEVANEAATAVVLPLPATREEATRDGRVGRRENAFLDTYFAFFGRFARWEAFFFFFLLVFFTSFFFVFAGWYLPSPSYPYPVLVRSTSLQRYILTFFFV